MINRRKAALLTIRIATDVVMVSVAWILAYLIRFYTVFPAPLGVPEPWLYLKMLPFIGVIWFFVMAGAGFYRRSVKPRSAFLEGLDIIQSCALATLAYIAFTFFYEEYRYSRGTLLIFIALHPVFMITGRSLIRKALRVYRRNRPPREVLIVGSGPLVAQSVQLIKEWDSSQTRITGVVVMADDGSGEEARAFCSTQDLAVLAKPTDWPRFLSEHAVQTVVIALPYSQYHLLDENLDLIANQVGDIKLIPDLWRYTRFSAAIEIANGLPVISLHDSPLEGGGALIKRALDLLITSVGLLVISPLLLVIAALVKFSSPGPIFYRQERMGLDGRTFTMLKFRSMPIDAENKTGAVWAKKEDNRATPIGSFLRRSSLDELPQLFNILKGEMSLVGPRPERPVFVEQFRQNIPGYMLRHKAKSGLTGWAQVNGWRGNTSLEKRIECDLYYIQNWSVWFDLKIILLTFVKGFFSKNAY